MHFRDKDEISARDLPGGAAVAVAAEQPVRGHAGRRGDAAAADAAGPTCAWGLEHPNAYLLVFCAPQRLGAQAATAEAAQKCYAAYAGVGEEIAAEGRLRCGDADVAAQALWGACHGLVALMITRPTVDWAPADELTSLLLEGLLHGLVTD